MLKCFTKLRYYGADGDGNHHLRWGIGRDVHGRLCCAPRLESLAGSPCPGICLVSCRSGTDLGGVCDVGKTGDQPVWAVRVVLCSILGAVGVITGLSITEAMYPVANAQPTQPTQSAPSVGSNNTVVNITPPPSMGSGNTFVGPTDSNGATILNRGGVAIGAGAQADPTSIAIGAGAGGGSVSHPPSQKP